MARLLKLIDKPPVKEEFGVELSEDIRSVMSEIEITPQVLEHGNRLMDLSLPDHTLAVMVKRNNRYFVPKGNTVLKENDRLLMISDDNEALLQSYESMGIQKYTVKNRDAIIDD